MWPTHEVQGGDCDHHKKPLAHIQEQISSKTTEINNLTRQLVETQEALQEAIAELNTTRSAANTRIAEWGSAHPHHPRLAASDRDGLTHRYLWEPFQPADPEPMSLLDRELLDSEPPEVSAPVYQEYEAAQIMWQATRCSHDLADLIKVAAPVWERYQEARADMERALTRVDLAIEGYRGWTAAVHTLIATHAPLVAAAQEWDAHARKIAARLEDAGAEVRQLLAPLPLHAAYQNINAFDWVVGTAADYDDPWSSATLATRVCQEISDQKSRIQETAALLGVESPA